MLWKRLLEPGKVRVQLCVGSEGQERRGEER